MGARKWFACRHARDLRVLLRAAARARLVATFQNPSPMQEQLFLNLILRAWQKKLEIEKLLMLHAKPNELVMVRQLLLVHDRVVPLLARCNWFELCTYALELLA